MSLLTTLSAKSDVNVLAGLGSVRGGLDKLSAKNSFRAKISEGATQSHNKFISSVNNASSSSLSPRLQTITSNTSLAIPKLNLAQTRTTNTEVASPSVSSAPPQSFFQTKILTPIKQFFQSVLNVFKPTTWGKFIGEQTAEITRALTTGYKSSMAVSAA